MKYLRVGFISLLAVILLGSLTAQDDRVLFDIEGDPVYASEFKYIYQKNNRDNADYSKESLEEYLELYVNFKLKVRKAKEKGYHESDQYKQELAGYRKQLADSYVIDREVIDRIADEIGERKQYDIRVKHILSALPPRADEERVRKELAEIQNTAKVIKEGLSFEEAVIRYSEDPGSAALGGDIGYLTATLPDGYIDLENAMYTLPIGKISEPFRTELGWHLVQVVDKRPARGTMEVGHILMRKERNGIPLAAVDARLTNLRSKIIKGEMTFENAARRNTEDAKTKEDGGYLGFFGIGTYEAAFEDAAFALAEDGQISEPIETSIGWHIIKRVSKRAAENKKILKAKVKNQMMNSIRFSRVKAQVVGTLQKEAGFKQNMKAIDIFIDSLDNTFFNYNWKKPMLPEIALQNYGPDQYTLRDFGTYVKESGKLRLKAKGQKSPQELALEIYKVFTSDNAISFAESRLEERYADFKNLMREYEEGILLFEITKDKVWDMAPKDTLGLKSYYEAHKNDYKWRQRANLVSYSLRTNDPNQVAMLLNDARSMTAPRLAEKYNTAEKELVMYTEDVHEVGAEPLSGLVLTKGAMSTPDINNGLKMTTFKIIESVIPPGHKTLREARGYIISDYQDILEKRWVTELKDEYKVKVKKRTLKSLIQK